MSNFAASNQDNWIAIVQQQVDTLRFGVVQIVVHDSKVVQIEKTEKVRITDGGVSATPYKPLPNQTTGGNNKLQ